MGPFSLVSKVLAVLYFRQQPVELPVRTTSINPPGKATFNEIAVSPNGKVLAFTATSDDKRQLWLRPLHAITANVLAGTEHATDPFWSPDSSWIGFFADGKLKKIEAAGGTAQTLCDATNTRGGSWGADGIIVFAEFNSGLFRVSAKGGVPAAFTTQDKNKRDIYHRWPVFLPDGRTTFT